MGSDDASDRYRRVESLYQQAVDLPADRRAGFLAERCASDPRLHAEVDSLLQHHRAAPQGFLETPAHALLPHTAVAVPERIGRYGIIRLIGRGGMGAVYEAEQPQPKRRVALKVIRADSLSEDTLRRFRFEAEILGRLRHPGIAQIYEFGVGALWYNGMPALEQPFFAMELVHGLPLAQFVAMRSADTRATLALLAAVCDAVHHAHQKGVIHRDLKPTNIVVDEDGQPKVLDFGVARVAHGETPGHSTHTSAGQLLGTIPYMSPEQLSGDPHGVDTRSDVYALGVIGYELLTGRLPFDLVDRSPPQAIRILAEREATPAGAVRRELHGDIDAILARALEKDADRRYATAAALADDLRRHLRGDPIEARRASAWYTLRKTVRRHRVVACLLGVIFLLTVGSAVALALLNWRAVRGWNEAEAQRMAADQARGREHDARTTAEAVNRFLHEMLASPDPAQRGRDVTVLQMLQAATARIDAGELRDQPAVAAAVLTTIGTTWQSLDKGEEAVEHFRRALEIRRGLYGDDHAEVADALNHLGEALFERGDVDGADRYFKETLAVRTGLFGETHPGVAECYNNLSFVEQERGRLDEAQQYLSEALRIWRATLGNDDASVELCVHNLSALLSDRGDFRAATPLAQEVYELRRRRHGREDHPLVVSSRNVLARCLDQLGRHDEAQNLHRQNLEINRRTLGDSHTHTRSTISNLSLSLLAQRKYAEAESLLREALDDAQLDEMDSDPQAAALFSNLGLVLVDAGKPTEGEPILRAVLELRQRQFPAGHRDTVKCMNNLAEAMRRRQDLDGANHMMEQVIEMSRVLWGDVGSPSMATYLHHHSGICVDRGECDRAESLLRAALAMRERLLGEEHPSTADTRTALARLLEQHGRGGAGAGLGQPGPGDEAPVRGPHP